MHILVTGAAGGMGNAICRRLRDEGCTVYGIDRKAEDGVFPCNVTSEVSVTEAFAKIRAVTDHLDAIVHTAGIYDLDSLLEMDEARFSRILEVNLAGVYRVNKAFLPLLGAGSRILITTSELAPLDPLPFTGVYAMTKAALEKYAFSLRMELRLLDISVSVLRPGAVQTDLLGDSTAARPLLRKNTALPLQCGALQAYCKQRRSEKRSCRARCRTRMARADRKAPEIRLQPQPQSLTAPAEPSPRPPAGRHYP